jgi:hypothetical protein
MSAGEKLGMKDRKEADAGSAAAKPAGGAGKKPKLSPEIQAQIGQQLRKFYDDMVNQGVPDRFADLINRLNEPKK